MPKRVENLIIENARIKFRNFSGKPSKFNKDGRRSVCVVIPNKDLADKLSSDGWNVKTRVNNMDPDAEPEYHIQAVLNYDNYPPKVYMVTSRNKVLLDEDTVGQLDDAEIKNVDVIIRPYCWEVDGKSGVKGYVKNMYVTIEEDQFADKYRFDDGKEPISDDDLPF